MSKPILGYWDIRGLAEPIRLMLEYCGIEFEDKRYTSGSPPDYVNAWSKDKFTLGMDFPNLPYYIEGDTKISESLAIMKHIARKSNSLLPSSESEKDKCDMLEGVESDLRSGFANLCYSPGFEANKPKFLNETLPPKLQLFEKYLSHSTWLSGDSLTFVDFAFAETLDHIRLMEPSIFDKYENISRYLEKFFKLEKIAAYRESNRFKKFPVNGIIAHWGGKSDGV